MVDATSASMACIAPPEALRSSLLQLPTELVVRILQQLPQADLRQVASVSRSLYHAAWSSGLYIRRTVETYIIGVDAERQFRQLNELIEYVLQRGLRLWLSIQMYLAKDSEDGSQSLALSFLSAITRSLPRLVGLRLRFRGVFLPDVYSALREPAPLLRSLKIFPDAPLCSGPASQPPLDIFSTVAPQLRTLGPRGNTIGPHLVPAFAQIRTLLVEYLDSTTATALGPLFPHLSSIQVYVPIHERNPMPLDVSGVELRVLVMRAIQPWEHPTSLRNVRLEDVIEVHIVCYYTTWSGPLWERDLGDYAVHLRHSERLKGWHIAVIPDQRPYQFVYHVVQNIAVRDVDRMPLAAQHLTFLRMDNTAIHCFLQCTDVQLSVLREICIDLHSARSAPSLIWPPDYPHLFPHDSPQVQHRSGPTFDGVTDSFYYYMRYPALEKVTIVALDTPMSVRAPEVAFFGRSLSLLDVSGSNKPTLALVGVDFTEWTVSHSVLLGRVFSSVTKSPFVGASFDNYDHVHCVSAPGDHLTF